MTSPVTHLKRALGWNLALVQPTAAELRRLETDGVVVPMSQRYATWRRSLLLVAFVATAISLALAVLDTVEEGFGVHTKLGVALDLAWLATAGLLPAAALVGVVRWTRHGAGAFVLRSAWAAAFLLPFVYALLPAHLLYHVPPAPPGEGGDQLAAWEELAVEFVLSGSGYLLLLPAVLSLIPGALNGCLRVKSLLPTAQLPGWLLVFAAPMFLLSWLVILVVVNHAARSALLVAGVMLWAGGPVLYSVYGKVFVRPLTTAAEVARVGRVKRAVGLTSLAGIGLLVVFALSAKVAGLQVIGFDKPAAVATKLDDLSEDDEVGWEDVQESVAGAKSVVYAFDLSIYRLVIDSLAKLLVVTAIFADLALRATLAALRAERDHARDAEADESTDLSPC